VICAIAMGLIVAGIVIGFAWVCGVFGVPQIAPVGIALAALFVIASPDIMRAIQKRCSD